MDLRFRQMPGKRRLRCVPVFGLGSGAAAFPLTNEIRTLLRDKRQALGTQRGGQTQAAQELNGTTREGDGR